MPISAAFRWFMPPVFRRSSRPAALLLLLLALASPALSHAQGTARAMDIDPSVRAAGMGLTSNAVFWDDVTNHWGNPALLGYQRGLSYEWGRTALLPGLAADIRFTTNVVKLGGAGVGVALSGKPIGLGGVHLSYGESEGTDSSGNPTGTFESFEQIDSWSFGLSLARAAEAVAVLTGHDPESFSRYADVSVGVTGKQWEIQLAPDAGKAKAHERDWGYLLRVTPTAFVPGLGDVLGLDLAYGKSDLSYERDLVLFLNEDEPAEVSEHERRGYAGRVSLDWPTMDENMAGPDWLWEGLHPLVSVGMANDHARIGTSTSRYETDGDGMELKIANVFSFRRGHYEDPLGSIDADTKGWGVGIPIGKVAGVRYDHATVPQAALSGLEDLKRNSASAWVDALRVWRMMRR